MLPRALILAPFALLAVTASAQVLPDGGPVACTADSQCGGCGWVCGSSSAICEPAEQGNAGLCSAATDCACAGQSCTGGSCTPAFGSQCLCDADCGGGQICDLTTLACHTRPTVCDYPGECGCGCSCTGGACVCVGGCGAQTCLHSGTGTTDGGTTIFSGGTTSGGSSANCAAAGAPCSSDASCCSASCAAGTCGCNGGEDPGTLPCATSADCCAPAFCDAGLCYQAQVEDSDGGVINYEVTDGGTSSTGGSSCSSASSSGTALGLVLAISLLWSRRRRSRPNQRPL